MAGTPDITSVELSWTENGSAGAWEICINGDVTNLIEANTSVNFPLTGLTPDTDYTVKVRANCGGDDGVSNWSNVANFTTVCPAITSFPWTEDFEAYADEEIPECWDNSASTSPTISEDPQYIWGVYEHGGKMLRMNNLMVQMGTALINTPVIELPSAGTYNLNFDYAHNANCGDFTVKISTNNGLSFTNLQSFSKGQNNSHIIPVELTHEVISLADYAGESIILQFYAETNYETGAIFLDNITIGECEKPTYFAASNITAHTAIVSWTGNSESYNIDYRTAAYIEGFNELFSTSLPTTGWESKSGLLSSLMGGGAFNNTTRWAFGTSSGVFNNHARINIYGNNVNGWLITPPIDVTSGYVLNFDLALTLFNSTLGAPDLSGTDDRFVVLVTTDNET